MSEIEKLDNYTDDELHNYFAKLLGFEKYEEDSRDKDTKNMMLTAKLTARDLKKGKFLDKPPEESHNEVPMGSLTRTNHRLVEKIKELSYKESELSLYKTTAYSTVGESEEKYDYMVFMDLVKK